MSGHCILGLCTTLVHALQLYKAHAHITGGRHLNAVQGIAVHCVC